MSPESKFNRLTERFIDHRPNNIFALAENMNNEFPSSRVILHQYLEFSYWTVIIITIALSYRYLPESRTDLLKYFEHEHLSTTCGLENIKIVEKGPRH